MKDFSAEIYGTMLRKTLTLDLIQLAEMHAIPRGILQRGDIMVTKDQMLGSIIVGFKTYIHGIAGERIEFHDKYPKDWWQAVKRRFFPKWALRRWPVMFTFIDISEQQYKAVCPHLEAAMPLKGYGDKVHLEWLVEQQETP